VPGGVGAQQGTIASGWQCCVAGAAPAIHRGSTAVHVQASRDSRTHRHPLTISLPPLSPPQGGLWIPCAGSKTPWGSHMGGEEYEPDARPFSEAKTLDELKALLKGGWGDVEGFMASLFGSPTRRGNCVCLTVLWFTARRTAALALEDSRAHPFLSPMSTHPRHFTCSATSTCTPRT